MTKECQECGNSYEGRRFKYCSARCAKIGKTKVLRNYYSSPEYKRKKREYHQKNREKHNEKTKQWRLDNRERYNEYHRDYNRRTAQWDIHPAKRSNNE